MTPFTLTDTPSEETRRNPPRGGTTVAIDLMKLGTLTPTRLIDLTLRRVELSGIYEDGPNVVIGALTTMADMADHPLIAARYPLVRSALLQSASPQIRNMATIGGNLLQRTRCSYFRDPASPCNKRQPGSGCGAIAATPAASPSSAPARPASRTTPATLPSHCWPLMPVSTSKTPPATTAASRSRTSTASPAPRRRSRQPSTQRDHYCVCDTLPSGDHSRSVYLKIRDRASYAFALASAAVTLTLAPDGTVTGCAIALGGLAAKPWRASEAEQWLMGKRVDKETALTAGQLALQDATATPDQGFKVDLGARTVARAVLTAAAGTDRC